MIFPNPAVNPLDWKAETERVASKLTQKNNTTGARGGWVENVANLQRHGAVVSSSIGSSDEESIYILAKQLINQIEESKNSFTRIENIINSKQMSDSLKLEYKNHKQVSLIRLNNMLISFI